MLLSNDYIEPAELTGYVRAYAGDLPINRHQLAQWLPNKTIDDLEYRLTLGGEGLTEAATYRAYDAESPIGGRPGLTRTTGQLPPVSRKIVLGEYDRLRQRQADGSIRAAILSDAERMVRAVAARIELARGDALVNGKVTLTENGLVGLVADYGRLAGHTNVAPGTLWSTVATATPIGNLLTWIDTYTTNNDGTPPGAIVTTTPVWRYFLQNAEVRTYAASLAGTPARVSEAQLRSVLTDFGIPPVYLNDEQVNVAGVTTRVIPQDALLLLPGPVGTDDDGGTDLGATLWGTTAESLEPGYGLEGDEPGIVAGSYTSQDPVATWTKAAAIALPVLANPNLSFHANVF